MIQKTHCRLSYSILTFTETVLTQIESDVQNSQNCLFDSSISFIFNLPCCALHGVLIHCAMCSIRGIRIFLSCCILHGALIHCAAHGVRRIPVVSLLLYLFCLPCLLSLLVLLMLCVEQTANPLCIAWGCGKSSSPSVSFSIFFNLKLKVLLFW